MKLLGYLGVFLLSASPVFAHTVSGGGGFLVGITHPVLGYDHLLAMLCVGIVSAQIGGRAIWTVPATFVSVMLLGGIAGIFNMPVPLVEYGIALSVLALGAIIALEHKLPTIYAMVFVGFFAIFHGHAHGTEMPQIAYPAFYATGFVLGTAGIHIAGVFIGYASTLIQWGDRALRIGGGAIAFIGVYILLGL